VSIKVVLISIPVLFVHCGFTMLGKSFKKKSTDDKKICVVNLSYWVL